LLPSFCYGCVFDLVFSVSLSIITIERKWHWNRTFTYPMCWSVGLSVGLSGMCIVEKRTWMPFMVVSGVGRGMGVLDGGGDR